LNSHQKQRQNTLISHETHEISEDTISTSKRVLFKINKQSK